MTNPWITYPHGPLEGYCWDCEEMKPYEGGEVDVEDVFDDVFQQREVFTCADCLAATS